MDQRSFLFQEVVYLSAAAVMQQSNPGNTQNPNFADLSWNK